MYVSMSGYICAFKYCWEHLICRTSDAVQGEDTKQEQQDLLDATPTKEDERLIERSISG